MTPLTANSVQRTYLRNLTLKLLSLALAFCVWSLATVSHHATVKISVPVRVSNIPPGFAIAGPLPAQVDITMEGPRNLVAMAKRTSRMVTLDLAGAASPGTTLFSHLESQLSLPEGIRVLRTSPASLDIRLEAEHSP